MQKKAGKILGAGATIIVVVGLVYFASIHKSKTKSPGEPQGSVEEILLERGRQAAKVLDTELAKKIILHEWTQARAIYHPEKDFNTLGEIVRSLYIESKMNSFSETNQNELFGFLMFAILNLKENNVHLAGLLLSPIREITSTDSFVSLL